MFETIQIARRYLLRTEYPDLAAALQTAASPAWAGGATSNWSASGRDDREGDAGIEDEPPGLARYWPSHPHF